MSHPSTQQLKSAVQIAEQIERLERELAFILGDTEPAAKRGRQSGSGSHSIEAAPPGPKVRKKSKISAKGRAAIIAAQKARWAKQTEAQAAPSPVVKKRKAKKTAKAAKVIETSSGE